MIGPIPPWAIAKLFLLLHGPVGWAAKIILKATR